MVVYYAWTVVTVAIGWGLWGLATATVARSVVGTAFIVALAPTGVVWPRYDRRRIRAMLGIGVRVQVVDFVAALRDQILVLGTAAIGSVSDRRLLEPRPASAPGAPDALVDAVARVLSSDVSDQVRRRGSSQHAATAPGCCNDPHRHAARAAGGRTRPSCRSCLERSGRLRLTLSADVPRGRHPHAGADRRPELPLDSW